MEAEIRFRDGDKEVILRHDVGDLEGLGEYLNELDTFRATVDFLDEEEPPPQPSVPPPPPNEPWGVIDVTEAFGKPGDLVEVEITGGTSLKVHGFHMGINYESNALKVQSVVFGPFLHAVTTKETRLSSARILVRGDPGVGNIGGGLVNIGFQFLGINIADNIEDSEVTGFSDPVIIPPGTVLATMTIRIKTNAKKKKYLLRNWTHRLGKPRIHTMYTTDLLKSGLKPELYDGSVTVT